MKTDINGLDDMSNLAAMPLYSKILKNLLLQNQWIDCTEFNTQNWVSQYYQDCYFYVTGLTLAQSKPMSNLSLRLLYGKSRNS